MGTETVLSVITKAKRVLSDVDETMERWDDAELLAWVNAGQRDIVRRIPTAYTAVASVLLAAGVEQTLPSGAYRIVRPMFNMGADGATFGRALTTTTLDDISMANPEWATEDEDDEILQVIPSERRETFYVYPPADGTSYISLLLSYLPTDITDTGDAITIDDQFANALLFYVLWCSFAKDAEESANVARAEQFKKAYKDALGLAEG